MNYENARLIAQQFVRDHHPQACAAIIGGSFASGLNTPSSDIDLFLLFDHVDAARRETLIAQGQVIELFVHDLATFDYFCRDVDAPTGRMPLVMMVVEGKLIHESGDRRHYDALLALATSLHRQGPPPLDAMMLARRRYEITNFLEDLVDSGNPCEALAIGARLYELLADLQLRRRGAWSGVGKHLYRRLHHCDPNAAAQLDQALRLVATDLEQGKALFALTAHDALKPVGGALLDGFILEAPAHWRSAPLDQQPGAAMPQSG